MQVQIDAGTITDLAWLRIGRFELALNKNPECVPEGRKEVWEMMWETETIWRLGQGFSLHFTKRLLHPQTFGAETDA